MHTILSRPSTASHHESTKPGPLQDGGRYRLSVPAPYDFPGSRPTGTPPAHEPPKKGRARKATSPTHVMLNYTYAILEAEATIAAHKLGLDPACTPAHPRRSPLGSADAVAGGPIGSL